MINYYQIIGLMCSTLLLQACNAGTGAPRPIAHTPKTMGSAQKPAIEISPRENEYTRLLQALNQRDPAAEAQQAMAKGERRLMGYYAGRAGLKFPGLTQQQQASQQCTLQSLEGLGDVIYGENHLKYRVAMRKFAKAYNLAMLPACL